MGTNKQTIPIEFDLNLLQGSELLYVLQKVVVLYARCLQDRKRNAAEFTHGIMGVLLARGLREDYSQAVEWFQTRMMPPDGTIN